MKIRLKKDARVLLSAGTVTETTEEYAQRLFSLDMAEPVQDKPEEKKPAKKTAAKK